MSRPRIPHCGVCGDLKEDNGKKLVCRQCNRRRVLAWQRANPERVNARNRRFKAANHQKIVEGSRRSKLRLQYGLEQHEYDAMFNEQRGVCAICGEPESKRHQTGKLNSLAVDHDHDTGAVRALICNDCNIGIAKFHEDAAVLRAAADYLDHHHARRGQGALEDARWTRTAYAYCADRMADDRSHLIRQARADDE